MKKVLVLVVVLILALSVGAFTFQNEPDGFRGLKWGDPPTEEMEFDCTIEDLDWYKLLGDKNQIGDAYFYTTRYTFFEEKFAAVYLLFFSEKNYKYLETLCQTKFGKASKEGFCEYSWYGDLACITLSYDLIEEEGFLYLSSNYIIDESIEAEKKKQLEKAEGDW